MKISFATCHVREAVLESASSQAIGRPEPGRIVEVEVLEPRRHRWLETRGRGETELKTGTRFVGVLGNRYAESVWEARLPAEVQEEYHLIAPCGLIGSVVDRPLARPEAELEDDQARREEELELPTRVAVRKWLVHSSTREPLKTISYPAVPAITQSEFRPTAKLIVVVAATMQSGKSSAARACVRALAGAGARVALGKVTGTARSGELDRSLLPHSVPTGDFCLLGYPSTYLLAPHEIRTIFMTLYQQLSDQIDGQGYVVLELADDVLQRETSQLLCDPLLSAHLHRLLLCAAAPAALRGSLLDLADLGRTCGLDLTPDILSGSAAGSAMGLRKIRTFSSLPVFNAHSFDYALLAEHIQGPPRPTRIN